MDRKIEFITNSFTDTQDVGAKFARQILLQKLGKRAVVLALSGDLGAGKTTFLQGFARGLGIKEKILSPTFIIMKKFKIVQGRVLHNLYSFGDFYHIDCYRLGRSKEILELGFQEIISNPQNIVAIEWPEKIQNILPKNYIGISFEYLAGNSRRLTYGKKHAMM